MLDEKFIPAWWLTNPHCQTLYASFFRHQVLPNCYRQRLITPDNDFIDLDWSDSQNNRNNTQPLVILLHGLTGSYKSNYIVGLQYALKKASIRSVVYNFRGCSGEMNNLARGYHSGDTADLDFVYQQIRKHEPKTSISFIGFSLGANVLLKWLGELGKTISNQDKLITCAIGVSVPFVLSECATRLDQGFSKIYRHHLLGHLIKFLEKKKISLSKSACNDELEKLNALGDFSQIKSFWQYDNQVVAKLHGFEGVDDYYNRCSCKPYLKAINIPTLLIQSEDDPFMTKEVMPKSLDLSAMIKLEKTFAGGHIGFISGNNPFRPEFWLEKRIISFLKQCSDSN